MGYFKWNLPTGLSFNTSNGVITGTPTEVIAAPGRQVIVRATDVGGLQGFQTITFQINPAPNYTALHLQHLLQQV
jgi:hypothetical protein